MSASINKVQLIGRLGKDPELRNLENGGAVCSFSLATDETWKDKTTGEKKQRTEWHSIIVWGPLAGICGKYLHKGSLIYIEGKNRTRKWEKDGVTRYITEVYVDDMKMLGSKLEGAASGNNAPQPAENAGSGHTNYPDIGSDDLPF